MASIGKPDVGASHQRLGAGDERAPRGASISSGDGGIGCAHNVRSMTAKRSRKRVASVREYVASKPKESRASLEAVRRAILNALPNAQEGLAYQMPAYTLNGVGVLYFAGWKSHYSLYPASDALVEAFAKELAPYERSKGTLKFPLSQPVPVRLIERIAKFRARQLTTRDAATGRRKGGREGQVDRIRRICAALPSAFEKMSHGTPCFFVEQEGLLRDVFRAPPRRWPAVALGAGGGRPAAADDRRIARHLFLPAVCRRRRVGRHPARSDRG